MRGLVLLFVSRFKMERNFTTVKELNLLKEALGKGIINSEHLKRRLEVIKEKEILDRHGRKIWKGSDEYYYTHVYLDGRRVLKKRKTKKELETYLIGLYSKEEEVHSFRAEFEVWLSKKESWKEIDPSTAIRYRSDFERFFPESEVFSMMDVELIDDYILEDFIKETIVSKNLTSKSYQNLKVILNGTLKHAKKRGHTNFSIGSFFRDFEISDKVFAKPSGKSKIIYTKEERRILYEYLISDPTIWNLGLALQCLTGLRMGELVSLKKEDNVEDCKLYIHRTETRKLGEDGKQVIIVKEEAKQGHNGAIYIPRAAQNIIDTVYEKTKSYEYLFTKDGKRMTEMMFNYYLRKACAACGVKYKSSHKMRKTYASVLLSNNVDETIVQNQMRHNDIATTRKYYYFNTESDENERAIIEKVTSL